MNCMDSAETAEAKSLVHHFEGYTSFAFELIILRLKYTFSRLTTVNQRHKIMLYVCPAKMP